jgi:hypothetical protein
MRLQLGEGLAAGDTPDGYRVVRQGTGEVVSKGFVRLERRGGMFCYMLQPPAQVPWDDAEYVIRFTRRTL